MKRSRTRLLILALIPFVLSGCLKEGFDPEAQFNLEKPIIESYVQEHIPEAELHENTGIWYAILEDEVYAEDHYEYKVNASGYVEIPNITVKYSGLLLDGTEFDSNDEGIKFTLGNTISAWQFVFFPSEIEGENFIGILPEGLKKGMTVRFVTPSYLAYGEGGYGSVPPNSPLDFTIEVLDIEAPQSTQQ